MSTSFAFLRCFGVPNRRNAGDGGCGLLEETPGVGVARGLPRLVYVTFGLATMSFTLLSGILAVTRFDVRARSPGKLRLLSETESSVSMKTFARTFEGTAFKLPRFSVRGSTLFFTGTAESE